MSDNLSMKYSYLLFLLASIVLAHSADAQKSGAKVLIKPMAAGQGVPKASEAGKKPYLLSNTLPVSKSKIDNSELYQPLIMAKRLPKKEFKKYYSQFLVLLRGLEGAEQRVRQQSSSSWLNYLKIQSAYAQVMGFPKPGPSCFNAGWTAHAQDDLGVSSCKGRAGDFDPAGESLKGMRQRVLGFSAEQEQLFQEWGASCGPQKQVPCLPLVGGWSSDGGPVCSKNSTGSCATNLESNTDMQATVAAMLIECTDDNKQIPAFGQPSWMDCRFVRRAGAQLGGFVENGCANQTAAHKKVCDTFVAKAKPVYEVVQQKLAEAAANAANTSGAGTGPVSSGTNLNDPSCLISVTESLDANTRSPAEKDPNVLGTPSSVVWNSVLQRAATECGRSFTDMVDQYGVCSDRSNQNAFSSLLGQDLELSKRFFRGFCTTDRSEFIKGLNASEAEAAGFSFERLQFPDASSKEKSVASLKTKGLTMVITSEQVRRQRAFLKNCLFDGTGIKFDGSQAVDHRPPRFQRTFSDKAPLGMPQGCQLKRTTVSEVLKKPHLSPIAKMGDQCLHSFVRGSEANSLSFKKTSDSKKQGDVKITQVGNGSEAEVFADNGSSTKGQAIELWTYECQSTQSPTNAPAKDPSGPIVAPPAIGTT